MKKRVFNRITILLVALMVGMISPLFSQASFAISDNDIIAGGVRTSSDVQSALRNGDGRHSASNIREIFNEAVGTSDPSDFSGMRDGYVYRDGRVVVSGQTVATDAESTGRLNFRDSRPLGDTGAFIHRTDIRFSQNVERLSALVKLNEHGEYQHAVIKSCGNPVRAKEVPVRVVEREVEVEVPVETVVEREVEVEVPVETIVEREVEVPVEVERTVVEEVVREEGVKQLPETGMGSITAGLFGATTLAGTVAHRIYTNRRYGV